MSDSMLETAIGKIHGARGDYDYSYNTGTGEHTLRDRKTQEATVFSNVDAIEFTDGRYKCLGSLFGGLYKPDSGMAALAARLAREIN